MNDYNKQFWEERHKSINDCLDLHTKRLDNHSDRIRDLEGFMNSTKPLLETLIDLTKDLKLTIKWATTFIIGSLAGFFIWYIQKLGGF